MPNAMDVDGMSILHKLARKPFEKKLLPANAGSKQFNEYPNAHANRLSIHATEKEQHSYANRNRCLTTNNARNSQTCDCFITHNGHQVNDKNVGSFHSRLSTAAYFSARSFRGSQVIKGIALSALSSS
ncbi:hypothetical protein [Bradyrhizobium commune]|uniref:hypothetical protein n=1 Tax=Bradyrhizobium commune TaxID=83627 RepID=UPI001FEE9BA6|nr:hypothetical protein [Bradyrhizobium commune]